MEKRPLCQASNNTCPNLAEQKGKSRAGKQKYGRLCDTHRRKGYDLKGFRNPDSKRYLPLNKCIMCNEKATDRHRVIPGSVYSAETVIGLCKKCHRAIHTFYETMKPMGYTIKQQINSLHKQ